MNSPYESLPPEAFWRTGVAGRKPDAIPGLYKKKFSIDRSSRIATAGSCFAQHIAHHLRQREYKVLDMEPAPPSLSSDLAREYGYGIYSARYANIYTTRQLLQLAREAYGKYEPADAVWTKDGRFYDALRPSVEPHGYATADEVHDHRRHHLKMVRRLIASTDVFVFTLGLTEAWIHTASGTVYPTAPGTIAGQYDPEIYHFHNFGFREVYADLCAFCDLAVEKNSGIRFLFTVSPVPLTATASGDHVLAATVFSKSILRAVAGELFHERENVDYFPSYEIITSAASKGKYFERNLRQVRTKGVDAVMKTFFAEHDDRPIAVDDEKRSARPSDEEIEGDDVVCEELLLEAFAK
jgi:hypothetical protein